MFQQAVGPAEGAGGDQTTTQQGASDQQQRMRRDSKVPGPGDVHLYDVLGVEKDATDDDIKRAYRKMALRYHPDKNPNDLDAEAKFKEVNYANGILSNPTKRAVYDAYGPMGLQLMESVGEDNFPAFLLVHNKWFKIFFICCGLITGCFCCCCCCCCCNCCCGKCKPKMHGEDYFDPDAFANTPAGGHTPQPPRATYNTSGDAVPIIISEQPYAMSDMTTNGGGYNSRHHNNTTPPPERPTVIAMPPPPGYESATVIDMTTITQTSAPQDVIITIQPASSVGSTTPSSSGENLNERTPLATTKEQRTYSDYGSAT